jgi:8-oxo-dGTP diphosphatase
LISPGNEHQAMYPLSEQDYIQQVSIDCVIFGYQEKELKVLVPKLDFEGDFWALPSGFIYQNEGTDQAARRILEERTGIKDIYLEQFRVFGNTERSSLPFLARLIELNEEKLGEKRFNRKEFEWFTRRFISISYYALVDINRVVPKKNDIYESVEWYNVKHLPTMIMDHAEIVEKTLETLRLNLDQKLIAFNLLPETFTMKEVQELYEAIFDKPFARNNFQKKILNLNVLERLEKKFTGAANKAPYLYRFRK